VEADVARGHAALGAHEVPGRRPAGARGAARVKADETSTEAYRTEQLKRLDGVATILAKTAARDTSLLALIADDAELSESGKRLGATCWSPPGSNRPEEAPPVADEPNAPTKRRSSRARSSPASWPTRSSPRT
jgi:hypothetical protein